MQLPQAQVQVHCCTIFILLISILSRGSGPVEAIQREGQICDISGPWLLLWYNAEGCIGLHGSTAHSDGMIASFKLNIVLGQ